MMASFAPKMARYGNMGEMLPPLRASINVCSDCPATYRVNVQKHGRASSPTTHLSWDMISGRLSWRSVNRSFKYSGSSP